MADEAHNPRGHNLSPRGKGAVNATNRVLAREINDVIEATGNPDLVHALSVIANRPIPVGRTFDNQRNIAIEATLRLCTLFVTRRIFPQVALPDTRKTA